MSKKLQPEEIRGKTREFAQNLGFDDCRIAAADEAAHAAEYRQWVADGCYGDMAWMAKNPERRTQPSELLPGARSVVTLALNYFVEAEERGRGKFARYAWGDDYHDAIETKLKAFDARLGEMGGRQRFYVDYGPVLERDFASEAGLGWNGKSTMQIHRRLGTWFFLAEVLTTLKIARDEPFGDHCGKCTRCIDVCPTQAITRPHRLDARRCISYLTIEHRGPIPEEFRQADGRANFWVRRLPGDLPVEPVCERIPRIRFRRAGIRDRLGFARFLALDEEGFRRLFRKSPVKRTKRRGFLRNVCVALGNVGTPEDLPALERAAREEEPLIAEHAQWAIAEILRRG